MAGIIKKFLRQQKPQVSASELPASEGSAVPANLPEQPEPGINPQKATLAAPASESGALGAGQSEPSNQDAPISEENEARLPEPLFGDKADEPVRLLAGSAQSNGKQRDHNEDAFFMFTATLAADQVYLPFGVYIVADGMGGHQHGEIASELGVRIVSSHILRKLLTPLVSFADERPDESIQEVVSEGMREAHRLINREAPGGGTTLTAAIIMGEQMTIAHVGDSRAYRIRPDGSFQTLTRDHSLVSRLVELGQLSTEEASIHPQRNVLYRAMGQGEPFDPDINTWPLPRAGYLLLCSDGLWGVVPEKELTRIIREAPDPQSACEQMVDAANAAGGPDNITVILVRIP